MFVRGRRRRATFLCCRIRRTIGRRLLVLPPKDVSSYLRRTRTPRSRGTSRRSTARPSPMQSRPSRQSAKSSDASSGWGRAQRHGGLGGLPVRLHVRRGGQTHPDREGRNRLRCGAERRLRVQRALDENGRFIALLCTDYFFLLLPNRFAILNTKSRRACRWGTRE